MVPDEFSTSGKFVREPRQTYENLNAQAFKNLNVKIEVEFLAGAVNNLTATVCGLGSILFTRRR